MDFNCLLITGSSLETNKDSVINVLNLLVYLPKTKKPWAHPPPPPPPSLPHLHQSLSTLVLQKDTIFNRSLLIIMNYFARNHAHQV